MSQQPELIAVVSLADLYDAKRTHGWQVESSSWPLGAAMPTLVVEDDYPTDWPEIAKPARQDGGNCSLGVG